MFERLAPEQHDSIPGVPEPAENTLLFGHEDAAALLAAAHRSGKLHHALIFAGPPGIGKATLAFHLAYHLLRHPRAEAAPETLARPDPASPLFRQIAAGAHPSVLHLTRPFNDKTKSFRTVLTVDEIRRVGRFLSMTAHDGGYRIVIVDPADDMNANAANALLKNLEEPPARALFILVAHSPGRLLPTIRSRCQTVRLRPLERQTLAQVLEALPSDMPRDPAALKELAARAEGSAREAILMTEFGGLEIVEALSRLLAARDADAAATQRLAEAVSGREQDVQFSIFNRSALDLIERAALRAAEAGDASMAGRHADLWREIGESIAATEAYNLDRKQHVIGLVQRMRSELSPR